MKLGISAFAATFLAAPLALACPGAGACAVCSGFATYVSSMSVGVLIGIASVGIESVLRAKRRR